MIFFFFLFCYNTPFDFAMLGGIAGFSFCPTADIQFLFA